MSQQSIFRVADHHSDDGPLVRLDIFDALAPITSSEKFPYQGLIDTGTGQSVVDEQILIGMGLNPTGVGKVLCPGRRRRVKCNVYSVLLEIMEFGPAIPLDVLGLAVPFNGIDCLLGLDFLQAADLQAKGAQKWFQLSRVVTP